MHGWLSHDLDFLGESLSDPSNCHTEINPASGLPMVGGVGGLDIEGNAYGFAHEHVAPWSSLSSIDGLPSWPGCSSDGWNPSDDGGFSNW